MINKILCFLGFHIFISKEDIGVLNESNPYANIGQLTICKCQECIYCKLIQVRSYGLFNKGWQRVRQYTQEQKKFITQNNECATISIITPKEIAIVEEL